MKKILILVTLLLIVAGGWWYIELQPVDSASTAQTIFVVDNGVGIHTLGKELKKENLIKSPTAFFLYIKEKDLGQKIQAGDFRLSSNMSTPKIVEVLQHGALDVWIRVPEGLRAEQIAEILKKDMPSYQDSWLDVLQANEGYLFPDSYLVPRESDINTIVQTMRSTFNKKIESIGLSPSDPNLPHIINEAALIEREAKTPQEKPDIASVINNRLQAGMPLQIDATVQYAIGERNGKWWDVPTVDDLKINSSYNTYKIIGLPPQPICNPGLTSIHAAFHPATTNYFYYVHDSNGNIHFAQTDAQHEANIERYLQ